MRAKRVSVNVEVAMRCKDHLQRVLNDVESDRLAADSRINKLRLGILSCLLPLIVRSGGSVVRIRFLFGHGVWWFAIA